VSGGPQIAVSAPDPELSQLSRLWITQIVVVWVIAAPTGDLVVT
jgi:hypothetical protein